jgi:hypothetical protein
MRFRAGNSAGAVMAERPKGVKTMAMKKKTAKRGRPIKSRKDTAAKLKIKRAKARVTRAARG